MVNLDIDHTEIERRKQLVRDLWDYRPVDHIPVHIWLNPYCSSRIRPSGPPTRQLFDEIDVHFSVNVERIRRSLRLIPDDYIPFARIVLGYMVTASMFGVGVHWSDDPYQPPGSAGPVIHDLEQVYHMEPPGLDTGMVPDLLRRLRYHAENLPPDVYLTGVNVGGPLQACSDIVETNVFYTGFYRHPDALHYLLGLITKTQQRLFAAVVEAAGGLSRMTSLDWDPVWAPEKYKAHLCDDVASMIAPRTFREFSIPYNNRIYQVWGAGLLHNCGPHPSKQYYMEHNPPLKGINCSYHYTRDELPAFRELFAGRAIVEVSFDFGESPEEMIDGFRYIMESLAPDTIGVPLCLISNEWSDDDVTAFYWAMRKIGEEYAANMKWVGAS